MPVFHFHSANGERVLDREGSELSDEAAARVEAVRMSGAILADNPRELWDTGHWRIEVTDDDNALLFTVITLAVNAPKPMRAGALANG